MLVALQIQLKALDSTLPKAIKSGLRGKKNKTFCVDPRQLIVIN